MFGVALALFLIGAVILATDAVIRFNDELRKLDDRRGAQEALREMKYSSQMRSALEVEYLSLSACS